VEKERSEDCGRQFLVSRQPSASCYIVVSEFFIFFSASPHFLILVLYNTYKDVGREFSEGKGQRKKTEK